LGIEARRAYAAACYLAGARGSAEHRRRRIADVMADYGICVDNVARKLAPDERAALRATNVLPALFLPEVEQRYKALKAQRQG
jgi:hypothetical protein